MGGSKSGRPCQTCNHPKLAQIDEDLCFDPNVRMIAARYGLTKSSIENHYQKHMPIDATVRDAARLAAIARHMAETRARAPEIEAREREREEQMERMKREAQQLRDTRLGVLDKWKQLEAANKLLWETIADLRKAEKGESRLDRHGKLIQALQRVEAQLELQAKLTGELKVAPEISLQVFLGSSEWTSTQALLVEAVKDHPEAAERVALALEAVGKGGGR